MIYFCALYVIQIGKVVLYPKNQLQVIVFFVGSSLISWRTERQTTISLTLAEAEYRALMGTCCELTWLRSFVERFMDNSS